MLTRNGSVPAFVMRTGMIQPMSPETARRDLVTEHIDMSLVHNGNGKTKTDA